MPFALRDAKDSQPRPGKPGVAGWESLHTGLIPAEKREWNAFDITKEYTLVTKFDFPLSAALNLCTSPE